MINLGLSLKGREVVSGFRGLAFLMTVALLGGCASMREPNFFVWPPHIDGSLQGVSELDSPFRATIDRRYTSEAERRLLAIVEATYPLYPRSLILEGFERPKPGAEPRWWLSTVDGIRIPLGVTRGSVEYFLSLIRSFRAGNFDACNGIVQKEAELEYTAEIEPAETAIENPGNERVKGLYIVRMELEWSSDCGQRCGLKFRRSRTAVVDRDGEVIEVLEDPLHPVDIE